ncbi:dihydroxyacetone kinase subunit L [Oerskovia turbata]|uniref:Dihydroxyacetone kinase subunit L n=1 Tax=Oerskovia turbata TaxID=1713 RepID=A0A4Q1L0N1_9CELL|nr:MULTISPECIES: dihydroxyacetone kinase subunit DhaL [Oerskovia]QDW62988.1 dihydroxyacetone kinase subunit L [Oerskovia sp. KBS0722]RXR27912.1 dihydroxyacetone kinase subunit L [Oerskovia turbata]RXR35650.1 dihydroxyacetone kinase subunit L [Oerskovia turbata]TGJ96629.1 dihydroxyacetone kinase subunit L [Actinotalea fermentans ATCC 43279 = JCM 9966 = DSM 3133]
MTLDVAWAVRWMRDTATMIVSARDELTELDRQIGDGDHGENLNRGFQAVVAKLDGLEAEPAQIGDVLKLVATTLMSSVGGASGPLYGTAFLRAAKVTGLAELDSSAVVALLEGALEGITARGKAAPGEKTMVDAWQPAVDAAVAAADSGADPVGVLEAALAAAEAGALATVPLLATKGRASYLGERSIGHQDPGATSTVVILRAAVAAATAPGE